MMASRPRNSKQPGTPVRGSQTGRPIMVLFDVLGQRWSLRILWELRAGSMTFRALQDACENLSPSVLNARLKALRALDLISHGADGYGLTAHGKSLGRELVRLDRWADSWAEKTNPAR